VAHLLAVCSLVIEHGGSEDQAIAALLHDAAEDQGGEAILCEIGARYGPAVAEIVADCTDAWTEIDRSGLAFACSHPVRGSVCARTEVPSPVHTKPAAVFASSDRLVSIKLLRSIGEGGSSKTARHPSMISTDQGRPAYQIPSGAGGQRLDRLSQPTGGWRRRPQGDGDAALPLRGGPAALSPACPEEGADARHLSLLLQVTGPSSRPA
jgi:hypothetical protein